jgi:hypothetical protein
LAQTYRYGGRRLILGGAEVEAIAVGFFTDIILKFGIKSMYSILQYKICKKTTSK